MSVVAIDGPAGAGKSTVGRAVAEALGWRYVDTGAMYRAIALCALQEGVAPEDGSRLESLARGADIDVSGGRVTADGVDVTDAIRRPEVTRAVSRVASHPGVRAALVAKQRALGASEDVVMEGRDIGTSVFPDALVKVFLVASLEERSRRRVEQAEDAGPERDQERVRAAIAARDEADAGRSASPLRQAPDAIVVDSTGRSVADVVELVVELVRERADRG